MSLYTKQQRIAEIAKRHQKEPITLLNHYIDEDWLRVAYRSLRKDSAPGIDYQSWKDYGRNLEGSIKSLIDRAKSGSYQAPAVRGVEIPKPGSQEKRPLGIPTIEDKVLQKGILMVLEPIYEPEFYPFSFGFRKGKSPHQALEYLWQGIMGNNIQWIIDLDIRKFFDTVKHNILRQLLCKRVRDGVIVRLIGKWLKAGVLKDGSIKHSDEGTPQGGIISPLLSNIYLHEALDKWYAEVVVKRIRERSLIVRYADDAVMGFESRETAEKVLQALKKRFALYGLELHPQKTRLIYLGKPKPGTGTKPGSFDFLGFTHFGENRSAANGSSGGRQPARNFGKS